MKDQFRGAIQNALALAGFLNISIDLDRIQVYSVYRNDKLKDYANPVRLRCQMHGTMQGKCADDWNECEVVLNFLGQKTFAHNKILLDLEDGTGTYCMK